MEDANRPLNKLDVLTEIGTIGAGKAATALADMLGNKVEISVPETRLVPLKELPKLLDEPEKPFLVIDTALDGEIGGKVSFLFKPEVAKTLAARLMGQDPKELNIEDPLFQSSLKEIVNILVGAYMSALSEMTDITIMFSVPTLTIDMVASILDFIFTEIALNSDEVLVVKTLLKATDMEFEGLLLFHPDDPSLKKIFAALGVEF